MPIPYIEDEEEDGTWQFQLRMTDARGRTEQYGQGLVTREVETKVKRQQESPSDVPKGVCACCCEPIPRSKRVYSGCCSQMVCKSGFGEWLRQSTRCMYCRNVWQKRKKQ